MAGLQLVEMIAGCENNNNHESYNDMVLHFSIFANANQRYVSFLQNEFTMTFNFDNF